MPKGAPTCFVDTCFYLKIYSSQASQAPQCLFLSMEWASKSSKKSLRPYFCQNAINTCKKSRDYTFIRKFQYRWGLKLNNAHLHHLHENNNYGCLTISLFFHPPVYTGNGNEKQGKNKMEKFLMLGLYLTAGE